MAGLALFGQRGSCGPKERRETFSGRYHHHRIYFLSSSKVDLSFQLWISCGMREENDRTMYAPYKELTLKMFLIVKKNHFASYVYKFIYGRRSEEEDESHKIPPTTQVATRKLKHIFLYSVETLCARTIINYNILFAMKIYIHIIIWNQKTSNEWAHKHYRN
jgi:hypothetical protein